MDFKLEANPGGTAARAGRISTGHGEILTPVFMPVGTVGAVKGVHARELRDDIKAQIILGNTYHLYLRPGTEILRKAGGLHKFEGWERPILTDSGGFQVFSLSERRKLTEEGAWFRSHIDGSKHLFTPERVVDIQREIGSDIMMALDECPPGTSEWGYARKSLDLTMKWLRRGWKHFNETEPLYGYSQAFFPIVQGCTFPDLRREAAKQVTDLGAEGNAIGGLAVGEPAEVMYEMIEVVNEILPRGHSVVVAGGVSHISAGIVNGNAGLGQTLLQSVERRYLALHLERRRASAHSHHLHGVLAHHKHTLGRRHVDGQHIPVVLQQHYTLLRHPQSRFIMRL